MGNRFIRCRYLFVGAALDEGRRTGRSEVAVKRLYFLVAIAALQIVIGSILILGAAQPVRTSQDVLVQSGAYYHFGVRILGAGGLRAAAVHPAPSPVGHRGTRLRTPPRTRLGSRSPNPQETHRIPPTTVPESIEPSSRSTAETATIPSRNGGISSIHFSRRNRNALQTSSMAI